MGNICLKVHFIHYNNKVALGKMMDVSINFLFNILCTFFMRFKKISIHDFLFSLDLHCVVW